MYCIIKVCIFSMITYVHLNSSQSWGSTLLYKRHPDQMNPKPSFPSLIAYINFVCRSCFVLYSGKSSWLKLKTTHKYLNWGLKNPYQVCEVGKLATCPDLWIENGVSWLFTPLRPLNPSRGTLLVPVTNCRRFAFSDWSSSKQISQNHSMTWELAV